MIDHKRYLYDYPRANIERKRKTEPWETYRYQHNESPEAGGFAMASGRGLSVAIKPLSRSKPVHGSPPDIIPYDNLSLEDVDSHIYATPEINVEKEVQVKEKDKDQGKSRKSKGASIKSKLLRLSRSLQKYKRRSTVDVNGEYDVPNPVNSTHRFSKPQYESAIPVGTRINNELTYSFNHSRAPQYGLAKPLGNKYKSTDASKEFEVDKAIYFEPIS
jgi:hypothetical protein